MSRLEIYEVKFNKFRLESGDVSFSRYVIGQTYNVGSAEITPVSIKLIKDRVHVTFSDGGKHVFGYNEDTELFYRAIKPITDGGDKKDNEEGA